MNTDWDEQIKKNAQLLQEMNEETRIMYEELGTSREELTEFLYNKENFLQDNWDTLQDERFLLEQKLEEKIQKAQPESAKNSLSTIQGHWIHVR